MRGSLRDYAHFVSMARGSLAEVRTQLVLAQRLEYTSPGEASELADSAEQLAKRLNALRRSLLRRLEHEDLAANSKTQNLRPKTERGVPS